MMWDRRQTVILRCSESAITNSRQDAHCPVTVIGYGKIGGWQGKWCTAQDSAKARAKE
jgi:hypothetical protein